jgi:hypothetical protein
MPAILTAKILSYPQYGGYYYIDISDLIKLFPHLRNAEAFKTFIVETRNNQRKLLKRFKPFKEMILKNSSFSSLITLLQIDNEIADKLNLGNGYEITLIFCSIFFKGNPRVEGFVANGNKIFGHGFTKGIRVYFEC